MFGKSKEELYLGQFVNIILQAILKSKLVESLPSDISLTQKELIKFKDEVLFLRVQLLIAQLMEIGRFGNTNFSNEDIGKTVGISLSLALKDTYHSKLEIEKIMDETIDHIGNYEDFLISVDEKELKKTGTYFQILQCFTDIVLGKYELDEEGHNKSFEVFSFGNQVYKRDSKTFKEMYKSVRFLD